MGLYGMRKVMDDLQNQGRAVHLTTHIPKVSPPVGNELAACEQVVGFGVSVEDDPGVVDQCCLFLRRRQLHPQCDEMVRQPLGVKLVLKPA